MKNSSPLKVVYKVIVTIVLILFVALATLTILSLLEFPRQFRIFVVETGSMSPTIPAGSLIIDSSENTYKVGDIITFNALADSESTKVTPITHRLTQIIQQNGVTVYETKGDANNAPDGEYRDPNNVIGKVQFYLPYVGTLVGFAKTQLGFVIVILIPTILIILSELNNIKKEFIKLKEKKSEKLNINT